MFLGVHPQTYRRCVIDDITPGLELMEDLPLGPELWNGVESHPTKLDVILVLVKED